METVNSLTKSDLISIVQKETGLSSRALADKAVDSILDNIIDCMSRGEVVNLTDFGSFKKIKTAERQGINPQTGESLTIPAGHRVKFKLAKKLKEALNEGPPDYSDIEEE